MTLKMFVSPKVLFQPYIAFLFEVPLEREIDYSKENNVRKQNSSQTFASSRFYNEWMAFLTINLAPNTFGAQWQ